MGDTKVRKSFEDGTCELINIATHCRQEVPEGLNRSQIAKSYGTLYAKSQSGITEQNNGCVLLTASQCRDGTEHIAVDLGDAKARTSVEDVTCNNLNIDAQCRFEADKTAKDLGNQ